MSHGFSFQRETVINTLNAFTFGILEYDISDHCPTFIIFLFPNPLEVKPKYKFTFRPYSDENQEKFIDRRVQTNWNVIYQYDNTDELLSVLCEKNQLLLVPIFPVKNKANFIR